MNEEQIMQTMLEKKVWAVIGANDNPEKYGNIIYKKLKHHGYEVYPINPSRETVDGDPCFKTLGALPKKPDVLEMVVSPKRGREYLEEALNMGIRYVWLQPGTYDDALIAYLKEKDFYYLEACVLVVLGWDR